MAMVYKHLFFMVLAIFILNVNPISGGSSTLRCYTCDVADTDACDDPPYTAVLPAVECREPPIINARLDGQSITDYVLSRTDDGQFSGAPIITDILLREVPANRDLNDEQFTFYCGKLILSSGESESIQRRCIPVKRDISDVCDFVREELDNRVQLRACSLCDSDLCNSSSSIVVSVFTLFILLCLSIFFQ